MHGGAISLADQFIKSDAKTDLIIASDMIDLSTFLALTRKKSANIPVALYFHENQLTYPWSPTDPDVTLKRDNHYAFINYTSALSADCIFFNSQYHRTSFLSALPEFLGQFPDQKHLNHVGNIEAKSSVLPLMMDLSPFHSIAFQNKQKAGECIFLWNHRWEYDKNPEAFFRLMYQLKENHVSFKLIVLGENYSNAPKCFSEAKSNLAEQVIHWGYAETFEEYASLLWQADVLPVTSKQDFFGGSVVEAIACNTMPLLPNRLSYPEHIPNSRRDSYLYQNESDLFEKAKWAAVNVETIRKENYAQLVGNYDVNQLLPVYENQMQELYLTSQKKSK
jgi:glycosyltransferase involved in cell wall biosynthesis